MTLEEELFSRHIGKCIALDSNLLLVLVSGSLDVRLFKSFKRVSEYTIEDYQLLVRLLQAFTVLIATPHVLTEVSNLANSLPESYRYEWHATLAAIVGSDKASVVQERWRPAAELVERPEFLPFGLTDTALTDLSSEALVVTEDYRLSGFLRDRGIPVLNFCDLRRIRLFAND
jgi:rRNA-processing protein FCF1